MKAFFFVDLYQDDIIADLADVFPGDYVFTVVPEQAAKFAGTRQNECDEMAGLTVKFNIDRVAQAAAGTSVDHFFLF